MNTIDFGIADGLAVVVIGFAMVFIILGFISFVLSIFSYVNKVIEKRNTQTIIEIKPEPVQTIQNIDDIQTENETDDLELVAVITAAIAASMNTSSDKLVIHSIRKTSDWNKAAIQENQKTYY